MAEIKGLGVCGICYKDLTDPTTGTSSPVRPIEGGKIGTQLAHKQCWEDLEAFKKTPGYKVQQAHEKFKQAFTAYRMAESNFRLAVQRLKDLGEEPDFEGNPHPEI